MRFAPFLYAPVLTIAGCQPADCPDGFTADANGLCLQGNPTSDTGSTDTDSGGDTDSGDTDTDTSGDTSGDTDTGDTETGDTDTDTDTGTAPACTVAADGSATYADIQDAVDDAADGDTIYVCAGTYEYVEIDRVDVTLVGVDGAEATVIDGATHPAVSVDGVTFAIEGFTLTGEGQASEPYTSALYATGSIVSVKNVIIRDCTVGNSGGATATMRYGASTWEGVSFEENDMGKVGSILTVYGTDAEPAALTLARSTFRENETGMLLYFSHLELILANNLFVDNALHSGSPFEFTGTETEPGSHVVWNNVFYGNTNSEGQAGPGLGFANVDFENNIVAESNYSDNGAISTALTSYNTFYNVGRVDGAGTGNLFENPHFTDPESGDFTLDAGFSPCVNAGNPLAGYNDPDGTRNDMGAFGGPGGGSW